MNTVFVSRFTALSAVLHRWVVLVVAIVAAGCPATVAPDPCAGTVGHPYRPPAGCSYLFAGQNQEQLGGLPEFGHTNGYLDHVATPPSGITLYGVFPAPNDATPFAQLSWVTDAERYLNRAGNEDMIVHLSIGWVPESLASDAPSKEATETALLDGTMDPFIDALADWLTSRRQPIVLRLGYEFNRPILQLYSEQTYARCFRYIVDRLRSRQVKGVAFVWASANLGFAPDSPGPDDWNFDAWYPGDAYVDWFGFSMWFPADYDTVMLEQARLHHRPVLLAETTPSEWDVGQRKHYPLLSSTGEPISSAELWAGWWQPMLAFVGTNADVVGGWHYIAADWRSDAQWAGVPFFANSDARLWLDAELKDRWSDAVAKPPFVQRGHVRFVR